MINVNFAECFSKTKLYLSTVNFQLYWIQQRNKYEFVFQRVFYEEKTCDTTYLQDTTEMSAKFSILWCDHFKCLLLKAILSMKVNLSHLYFGKNTSISLIASLQTPLEIARKGSSNEVVEILDFFLTINKSTCKRKGKRATDKLF